MRGGHHDVNRDETVGTRPTVLAAGKAGGGIGDGGERWWAMAPLPGEGGPETPALPAGSGSPSSDRGGDKTLGQGQRGAALFFAAVLFLLMRCPGRTHSPDRHPPSARRRLLSCWCPWPSP